MSGITITNSTTITTGQTLTGNDTLINTLGGIITAPDIATFGEGSANVVVNAGDILGIDAGIALDSGGAVANQVTGTILAMAGVGVDVGGVDASVTNYGVIDAETTGVSIRAGGTVENQAGGSIIAGADGIIIAGGGGVTNAGTVTAVDAGVSLTNGGSVTNQAGGRIEAPVGIRIEGAAGTITQAGSILSVGGTAVAMAAGFTNRLILDPGAATDGVLDGGNVPEGSAVSTLELAAGTGVIASLTATLSVQVVNFAQLLIDVGAQWLAAPSSKVTSAAAILNLGTLTLDSGSLTGSASVTNDGLLRITTSATAIGDLQGTGVTELAQSGTLQVAGTVAADVTIDFSEDNGRLGLLDPLGFEGLIEGFSPGDIIDLPDTMVATSGTILPGNTLSVSVLGSATPLSFRLDPTQDFSSQTVTVNNDLVSVSPPCFRAGTRIMTAWGLVAVESLRVGDLVLTAGPTGDSIRPVRWIGWRSVDCSRHPDPEKVWPVRISAGAFSAGLPARDLWLSPDHAVYVDGVLIPAKHLVDGLAITQEKTDRVRYFHVELPEHDVIMAEGLPCESYLDADNRSNFENGGGVIRLHPDFSRVVWEASGCAPLHVTGPVVTRTRTMLRERAERKQRRRKTSRAAK